MEEFPSPVWSVPFVKDSLSIRESNCVTKTFPSKPYQPDFASNKYIREYNSLFDGMGVQFSNKTITIPRADYPAGYTLYVFDLTSDHSASPPKTGSIRLEIKFAAATAATINVLLDSETRSRIEIDKYRNVIGPF